METITRTYDATVDNLHSVLDFVESELEKHEASMKNTNIILVCVEEIYANIALYGYPETKGEALVELSFDSENVAIKFVDSGIAFDPLAKIDPDIHAAIEDRGIGGLGIYMVKKSMDDCEYKREDNKNIFIMRKSIK